MISDRLFAVQSFVSIMALALGGSLIFYDSDETRFTIGISIFSSIVGYWLPSPQQNNVSTKEQQASNGKCCCCCSKNKKKRKRYRDVKNETQDGIGQVENGNYIDVADNDDSDSDDELEELGSLLKTIDKDIGGLSPSVKSSIARIESGESGKSPHVITPKPELKPENDTNVSNADMHIAV